MYFKWKWMNSINVFNHVTNATFLLLFSCSAVSNSLRPHGLQHTRLPCPSPSPGEDTQYLLREFPCFGKLSINTSFPTP